MSSSITYWIVLPYIWLEEDARVPDDPADVVHGQSHKEVLVHLDAATIKASGKVFNLIY